MIKLILIFDSILMQPIQTMSLGAVCCINTKLQSVSKLESSTRNSDKIKKPACFIRVLMSFIQHYMALGYKRLSLIGFGYSRKWQTGIDEHCTIIQKLIVRQIIISLIKTRRLYWYSIYSTSLYISVGKYFHTSVIRNHTCILPKKKQKNMKMFLFTFELLVNPVSLPKESLKPVQPHQKPKCDFLTELIWSNSFVLQ